MVVKGKRAWYAKILFLIESSQIMDNGIIRVTSARPFCSLQPAHFRPLREALIHHGKQTTLICESPEPFEDAVMMKALLEEQQKER